jgi:hypothetical protein
MSEHDMLLVLAASYDDVAAAVADELAEQLGEAQAAG